MPNVPIGQLLGSQNLIGVIQRVARGLPNPLPPSVFSSRKQVKKNYGTYRWTDGQRAGSRLNTYGNPATQRAQLGMSQAAVMLYHSFEYQAFDADVLINLTRSDDPTVQDMGREEIERQTLDFATLFQNTRIGMAASMLAFGKIWFAADGTQYSYVGSGSSVTTIDGHVPAVNRRQADGVIGTGWSTTGVDIIGDLKAIKNASIRTTGLPLKYAFYGANIPSYFGANSTIKNYLNATPDFAKQMVQAKEIPDGLLGLTWIDASSMFIMSGTSAIQLFTGDMLTLCPEFSPNWWLNLEGSYIVPRGIGNIGANALDMLADIAEVYGMFSYAAITHNPVSLMQYAGDTCLPTITNPSAIYQLDVTP